MFQILAYISHWFRQVDEHSLHSPFLFEFYSDLVKNLNQESIREIELLRNKLLNDQSIIDFQELGAGSRINKSNQRKVSSIAKFSTTPIKFSIFLKELITKYKYSRVLELGTSFGLNTLYMSDNKNIDLTTIEGEPSIAKMAKSHFEQFNRMNINLINSSIDEVISSGKLGNIKWDMIYMDANHSYVPTLKYFNYFITKLNNFGVIVIDDIHWSKGMSKAWHEIKTKPEVSLTIDLFEAGLVFINENYPKEDYILKF